MDVVHAEVPKTAAGDQRVALAVHYLIPKSQQNIGFKTKSLDSDRFCQIARLVYVCSAYQSDVIGQQLQGNDV